VQSLDRRTYSKSFLYPGGSTMDAFPSLFHRPMQPSVSIAALLDKESYDFDISHTFQSVLPNATSCRVVRRRGRKGACLSSSGCCGDTQEAQAVLCMP